MNDYSLIIMNYKCRINSLEKQVEAYRSSEKYEQLRNHYQRCLKEKDSHIQQLKQQRDQEALYYKKSLREWETACHEIYEDSLKQLAKKEKELKRKEEQLNKAYQESNEAYDKIKEQELIIASLQKQLDEALGKNAKLTAQVNKDYHNSSKPSSSNPYHKKIENGRKPTERKPGGQKGHEGHCRKQYTPTTIIPIPPLQEYLDSTKYKATGRMVKKQVVEITLMVDVKEYQTPEYRCLANRQRVHAPFPAGVVNEVNLGASVQALAFLLNNRYNVSIAKTKEFLCEASRGVFNISTGCINQLVRKFAKKTKDKQAEIFDDLVKAPVLHTDFTTARVNGKLVQILVCFGGKNMMYYGREHKGYEGVKDSPVEYTTNTLVHDHEITFFKYGSQHQECIVHVLRYLRGSIENEKQLRWNRRMRITLEKMIHYVKEGVRDAVEVQRLIKEYDQNLEIADLNYKEHPPTKYYREGYNLAKRMREYRKEHLLFLLAEGIPYDNNISERYARVIKRKLNEMMTFRSYKTFEDTCSSLGILETMRLQGGSLLDQVIDVFDMGNRGALD